MRIVLTLLFCLLAAPVHPDQFLIPNARESQDFFWKELYPGEGWTLYCGEFFNSRENVSVEYVYPVADIATSLQCGELEECRANHGQFNRIEADLHNMYPALPLIVEARENYKFGIIAGEFREFFECDFEHDVRDKVVEPRAIARGNIARAMLYMFTEYKLPLTPESVQMFKEWNIADPPSKDELRRNDVIEKLQGTRNPYIDNPKSADSIQTDAPQTSVAVSPPKRETDRQIIESF